LKDTSENSLKEDVVESDLESIPMFQQLQKKLFKVIDHYKRGFEEFKHKNIYLYTCNSCFEEQFYNSNIKINKERELNCK
jgi:hypothetical protein